jgi:hypothetical protein
MKLKLILMTAILTLVTGCTSTLAYRSLGDWDDRVVMLGPVSFCQGGGCTGTAEGSQWPLALSVPPSQDNIHAALVSKAIKQYNVPERELVLRDVNVTLETEIVGTVRGWNATAVAGRKRVKP